MSKSRSNQNSAKNTWRPAQKFWQQENTPSESASGITSSPGPLHYSKYSNFKAGWAEECLRVLLKASKDIQCRYKLTHPKQKFQSLLILKEDFKASREGWHRAFATQREPFWDWTRCFSSPHLGGQLLSSSATSRDVYLGYLLLCEKMCELWQLKYLSQF